MTSLFRQKIHFKDFAEEHKIPFGMRSGEGSGYYNYDFKNLYPTQVSTRKSSRFSDIKSSSAGGVGDGGRKSKPLMILEKFRKAFDKLQREPDYYREFRKTWEAQKVKPSRDGLEYEIVEDDCDPEKRGPFPLKDFEYVLDKLKETTQVLFVIFITKNGKVEFNCIPEGEFRKGCVLHRGVYYLIFRKNYFKDIRLTEHHLRGFVSFRPELASGFVRIDPPAEKRDFLSEKSDKDTLAPQDIARYEEILIKEYIDIVCLLAKGINPDKELIFLDSVKDMFANQGIVLPDKLTIGSFVETVKTAEFKPKTTKPRTLKAETVPPKEIITKTHARHPVTITNRLGLHVGVASVVESLVKDSKSRVTITKGRKEADASSLEQLAKLAAEEGDTVVIEAKGEDAMDVAMNIKEALKDESILGNIGSGIKSSSAGAFMTGERCGGFNKIDMLIRQAA